MSYLEGKLIRFGARSIESPELGTRIVWVKRGRVHCSDEVVSLAESFPGNHQSAIVPSTKRTKYAWQNEYRFTIATRGKSADDRFALPLTPELKNLVRPHPRNADLTKGWNNATKPSVRWLKTARRSSLR